eukprot:6185161-Pleurochrysis_carterae.AAC.1
MRKRRARNLAVLSLNPKVELLQRVSRIAVRSHASDPARTHSLALRTDGRFASKSGAQRLGFLFAV